MVCAISEAIWSPIQGLLKLNAALLFAVGLTTLALRHPSLSSLNFLKMAKSFVTLYAKCQLDNESKEEELEEDHKKVRFADFDFFVVFFLPPPACR